MKLNDLRITLATLIILLLCSGGASAQKPATRVRPVIQGAWRNITGQPDLGVYNGPNQQPVDFAVWKAADGTWQLWSCIRGTKIGGNTRLFYRWEAKTLDDTAWTPKGIAMTADTTLGEIAGGLQAPFVFKNGAVYEMVYGDWNHICRATSHDGKSFHRVLVDNKSSIFTGPLYNTRDPMVIRVGSTFYCYYCGHNEKDDNSKAAQSATFCRTSRDLSHWSAPVTVSKGGSARAKTNWYGGDSECPFVVKVDKNFILFRNQRYGSDNLNTQYCSANPLDFGVDTDQYRVSELAVAAPEIIEDNGQHYIVSLRPDLRGMRIARLGFEDVP